MNREERVVKYINSSDDFVINGKRYCENDFYNDVEDLVKQNKKYKEVIEKAIELNKQVIKDTKEFYRPTKDIIYSGDTLIDIAEQNLKILKEVE